MLLQHLRDHRAMDDGVGWSAQADFAAQLADWEHDMTPHGRCCAPSGRLSWT